MARYAFAIALVVGIGIGIGAAFLAVRHDADPVLQGPPPPPPVPEAKLPPGDGLDSISAVVQAVGPDWIEVHDPVTDQFVRYPVRGEPVTPPPPNRITMEASHRLWDVRPGDKVALRLVTRAGVEWCEEIDIYRRPGGTIPPFPGEVSPYFPEGTVTHRRNAEQAWEERGVPLPPAYADPNSHSIGAPMVWLSDVHRVPFAPPAARPVAPPPRPVGP